MPGVVKRYLIVVGLILVVIIGVGIATKPKPGEMRKDAEEAMADYAKAQKETGLVGELVLPSQISNERDWLVAVSYSATQADGKTYSCWGAFHVTVCNSPKD
jgi:hypothetical protein